MRILIGSDPHIYPDTAFSRPTEDGLTTHLHDIIQTFEWFRLHVAESKPDWVFITGDIFHTHDYIDARSLKVAHQVLTDLHRHCRSIAGIPLEIVLGNHELYNASQQIHLLHWLNELVIDKMGVRDPSQGDGVWFHYVPFMDHTPENEDRLRQLSQDSSAKLNLFFTHLEIVGATRQVGSASTKGFPIDVFPPGAVVVNGHYHHPHSQNGPDGRVIHHVGSLMTRSFSDTEGGAARGLLQLDIDTTGDEVRCEATRIEGVHHKKFKTIHIRQQQDVAKLELMADQDRTNVKVICHDQRMLGSKTLEKALDRFHGSIVSPGEIEKPDDTSVKLSLDTSVEANLDAYLAELDHETLSPLVDLETVRDSLKLAASIASANQPTKSRSEVRFKRLVGHNFLSFKDFDIELDDQGLVMVEGENLDDSGSSSNGSGKSAIWEALFWVLYDKTLRGVRKTEVKWRNGKASKKTPCRVQLELEIGDISYIVERYRDDPERGTGAGVVVNGETISPRLAGDVQDQIDDLIGVDADMAQHLWLMTQGLTHRFMGLGDADRKRLVESMIDLSIYDQLHTEMRTKWRTTEIGLLSRQGEAQQVERQLGLERERRVTVSESLAQYRSEVRGNREEAEQTKTSLEKNLETWRLDIESARGLVNGEQARIDELEGRRDDPTLRGEYEEVIRRIARLSSQVSTVKDRICEAQQLLDAGKCPTCGQSLDNADAIHRQVEQDVGPLEAELATLKTSRRNLDATRDQIVEEIAAAKEQRDVYRADVGRLEGWIASGESRLREAETFLSGIERRESDLVAEAKLIDDRVEEYIRQVEQTTTEVRDAEIEVANLDFTVQLLAPTGMRSLVLRSAVEYLNGKLAEYSDILLGGERVVINNKTELKSGKSVDKFSVDVHGGRSYAACSSGERRRADLVIQFALNALARATTNLKMNLLVTDEIDDKLDVTGMENLVRLLQMIANDGLSVFLVTQHSFLKGMIPKRWVVRKERGVSQLMA